MRDRLRGVCRRIRLGGSAYVCRGRAVQIACTQCENGLVDLLPVRDTQRLALAMQLELAQSKTELLTSLVALFKATGGRWSDAVIEKAPEDERLLDVLAQSRDNARAQ